MTALLGSVTHPPMEPFVDCARRTPLYEAKSRRARTATLDILAFSSSRIANSVIWPPLDLCRSGYSGLVCNTPRRKPFWIAREQQLPTAPLSPALITRFPFITAPFIRHNERRYSPFAASAIPVDRFPVVLKLQIRSSSSSALGPTFYPLDPLSDIGRT